MKFKTNPDKEFAKEMKDMLKSNNGYCDSFIARNKDTKCPCKEFKEQTDKGYCRAGLYFKD